MKNIIASTMNVYKEYLFEGMLNDNCHTENWETNEKVDKPDTPAGKLFAFIRSLFDWFTQLVEILRNKANAE